MMIDRMPRWAILLAVFGFIAMFGLVLNLVATKSSLAALAPASQDPVERAVLAACKAAGSQLAYIEAAAEGHCPLSPAVPARLRQVKAMLAMYPAAETSNALQAIDFALQACKLAGQPRIDRNAVNSKLAWARLNISLAHKQYTPSPPR